MVPWYLGTRSLISNLITLPTSFFADSTTNTQPLRGLFSGIHFLIHPYTLGETRPNFKTLGSFRLGQDLDSYNIPNN